MYINVIFLVSVDSIEIDTKIYRCVYFTNNSEGGNDK